MLDTIQNKQMAMLLRHMHWPVLFKAFMKRFPSWFKQYINLSLFHTWVWKLKPHVHHTVYGIWGFHGGKSSDCGLLSCDTV